MILWNSEHYFQETKHYYSTELIEPLKRFTNGTWKSRFDGYLTCIYDRQTARFADGGSTHIKDVEVVVNEVLDDLHLVLSFAVRLEETGREQQGEVLGAHLVEISTLLNPGSETEPLTFRKTAVTLNWCCIRLPYLLYHALLLVWCTIQYLLT